MSTKPFVVSGNDIMTNGWNEPEGRGVLAWQALVDADANPSASLTSGIAVLEAGGFLALHRHAPVEFYYVLEGSSTVTVDGTDYHVNKGDSVFIPPMAEHGIFNRSAAPMRLLYVFPTNTLSEIEYVFS
jgi:quercetin dioxygenase-like cupin family protein